MKSTNCLLSLFLGLSLLCSPANAQQVSTQIDAVPHLVNFSGLAIDAHGKVVTGTAGVTFAIYSQQSEGVPLWLETQNVQPDSKGNYTVQLGATKSDGLPLQLFSSGEARWLGVRVNGGEEQPRVLLLSVPYALKAADAETVGGLPPSAFVLAAPVSTGSTLTAAPIAPSSSPSALPAVGGSGTTNYIPIWTDSSDLGSSILFQSGSGSSARIGIGLNNPLFTLDVKGSVLSRGLLELATTNFATPAKGYNSQPFNLESSAYSSSTNAYTLNHFQWQAEPIGNNTTSPAATLNLLYGTDPASPAETGLKLSSKGVFTFATGQTFPGAGTVSSVGLSAPSSDFSVSGSPITASGTLGLAWKVAPTSADTANAIVKRDGSGNFSAGAITVSTVNALELFGFNPDGGEGVLGVATGSSGQGVWGESDGTEFENGNGPDGVHGVSHNASASGVAGLNDATTGGYGVFGQGNGYGVYGYGFDNVGVFGSGGAGVYGQDSTSNSEGVYGIGDNSGSYAGFFVGNVFVSGSLSKGGGSFKIDHPLDPANKYLYHSFVESPDMMNVYNGNVVLDGNGEATIQLPEWFQTLNRDFRYQLTCIGGFAPVYVAAEIAGNHFQIAGGHAGIKVSWQVTGIRQDPWANAYRIPVEEEKSAQERGFYLHPELYGQPVRKRVDWARHPGMMKRMQEEKAKHPVAVQSASRKQSLK
jgi:hypothetical protein